MTLEVLGSKKVKIHFCLPFLKVSICQKSPTVFTS